ncbi:potassium channel subfamily K member 1 isoform X2 [Lepeophtheirus salmonis]|uniref:potassium channel subfamily K member 1 isoform X1 n=1 Tax=Lepeophtheirus salmonis TaxID=72036 RepID=UPI001AE6206B|nr:potassium channel subfamily K member 1-like isoform X1 [Lepeophtheirus salmonis]XP_040581175.1 potassium channel subfamily K member 1-like isoform X2 [Lepeophtheirus salmonis]
MAQMLLMDAESLKKKGTEHQQLLANDGSGGFSLNINNWRIFGLGIFFLIYLLLGALVFSAIEAPIEKSEADTLLAKKQEFLKSHPCLSERSLEDFISAVVDANSRGVALGSNGSFVQSWSFGQSFFFASTVVTTIGYGHQTPLSTEGKIFCIVYALVGIPMTLLLLSVIVEKMMVPSKQLLNWMMDKVGHIYTPFTIRLIHLFMIIILVFIFLFIIPAIIFAKIESNWNMLDSIYYCFISLTTVGLGDFIPGDTPGQKWRPLYKAFITIYLLIGVTVMMFSLCVFYDIPQFDFKLFFLLPSNKSNLDHIKEELHIAPCTSSKSDTTSEKMRLKSGNMPQYNTTSNIPEEVREGQHTTIVRARSRPTDDDDSPSSTNEISPAPLGAK